MARHAFTKPALFCFLSFLFLGSPLPTSPSTANSASQADSVLAGLETRVFKLVNQYRQSHGRKPLDLHRAITYVARLRSRVMANSRTLSHDGFGWAAKMLENKTPYEYVAENLSTYWGYQDPADAALEGWIKSDTHRETMLENFDLTGIGVARDGLGTYYFTQLFIRSR